MTTNYDYRDEDDSSILTTIFFYSLITIFTFVIATMILGWIIGTEAMVEMIGEWIYELKFEYAAKI